MDIKKRKKRRQKAVVIALVVAGAAFFQLSGILKPVSNGISGIGNAIGKAFFQRGSAIKSEWDDKGVDPSEKIKELEAKISELEAENASAKMLEEENAQLRAQIDFSEQAGVKSVPAKISAREVSFGLGDEDQKFVIDRGSRDGLKVGFAVTNQQGVVLGKLVDVSDDSSTLCLIVSRNCQFPASITNSNKTSGLTEGNLGLTIKMNYIPQSEAINVGDYVVTSGLGGNMPRGLFIGKVSQVNSQTNEVWQDVTIEPGASIDNSTIVSVIIP